MPGLPLSFVERQARYEQWRGKKKEKKFEIYQRESVKKDSPCLFWKKTSIHRRHVRVMAGFNLQMELSSKPFVIPKNI